MMMMVHLVGSSVLLYLHFPTRCILYRIINDSELEYRLWMFTFTKQISINNSYTYWLLLKVINRSSDLRHIPADRTSHILRSGSLISRVIEFNRLFDLIWRRRRSWERVTSGESREVRVKSSSEWFSRGMVVIKWPWTENVVHYWELWYTKRWNSKDF